MYHRATLVLARSREFPHGNRRCFYELLLPLTKDGRLDLETWNRRRYGHHIRRYCRDIGEARGELKHNREGWFVAFGHGEASDEAFFAGGEVYFSLGGTIPIVEWDGQTRIFRVVDLMPVSAGTENMAIGSNSPLGTDPLPATLHELTEPLTALAGYAAAARHLCETDVCECRGRLGEILDKIPDEAQRAGKIVDRLGRLLPPNLADAAD